MNKDQIIKQLRDMAKHPTVTLPRDCEALKAAADLLAYPQQESNKDGSPCPEFWDWLPKAYNFEGNGNFTKYNMEVAFLAGKQASQPEQEPVAWATRMGEYAHIKWGAKRPEYPMVYETPLYTTPPQRKPLTDEQIENIANSKLCIYSFARAIEAAHGIKE